MSPAPADMQRLQQLFAQALELPPAALEQFIAAHTLADAALGAELRTLLAAHGSSFTAFDRPLEITAEPAEPPDEQRWIGQRLGPWRVTRRIGQGGMGTVCEAVRADEQFQKRVAIKFLRRHAAMPIAVDRFRAERQILANLDHPNVATLLDGGVTDDGQPYLVMEYIDGEPITAWADAHGLACRARVLLFLQVCAAVEAAHRNLIVHRDIKPGNILVNREGRVKLLDFGIARLLDEDAPEFVATRASEAHSFTPQYAAPEQMRALPVSTGTDVFALGVVLFRMLTLQLPFDRREDPETPAPAAGLEPDLDAILARALQVRPADRYASVQDLRMDLERWRDGLPVAAHPDSRAYRAGKFLRRHRAGAVIVTLAVAGILAASSLALWQAWSAQRAAGDLRQMNAFLMDVLRMSNPFDEGGEMTLSQALDRAAGQIDARFAGRPDLSAQIRFGIGHSMVDRYRLEQAEGQLARALQESTAEFGARDIRTLRVLEAVAGLRLEQSHYEDAEREYLRVIAALESRGLRADPLYAQALGNIGNLYLQREDYPRADAALLRAQAVDAREHSMQAYDHATLLSNLAHAAHGLEDYPRAERLYAEAAQALRKLFPEGSPDLAILYNNHALLREERGDVPAAIAMHEESLAMRRKVFHDAHPMVVTALANLARLQLQGDTAAAMAHAQEGAAMADQVFTEPNRFHPSVYATLAAAHLARREQPAAWQAWSRAHVLLAAMPDAPPTTAAWVERVHRDLCAKAAGTRPAGAACPFAP
ncbi:MAG: serine/threonine-protein kinase [Steroidobacteraceae bacterium]